MVKNKNEKDVEIVEEKNEDIFEEETENFEDYKELTDSDRILKIEKATKLITILVIIGLLISIVNSIFIISIKYSNKTNSNTNTNETQEQETSYDTSKFNEITMSDIKKASKGKTIAIFVGRQGCIWCAQYAPIITKAQEKYNFKVQYVDFGKIIDFTKAQPTISDKDAYELLVKYIEDSKFASEIEQGMGTPMTLFIKDNKLVDFINGFVEEDTLATYLKNNGFDK